jgi:hypothetical protein
VVRRKPYPSRPDKPFRIGTVQWNLQNVAKHVNAGFAPVADVTVRGHYLTYLKFLRRQGYLQKDLPEIAEGWDGELWSHELTIEGYRFTQYSHDRWIGRILKYEDAPGQNWYLDKWHLKFLQLPPEMFSGGDA